MQLNALASSLGHFFSELQRRKVLRIASGYVVAGWIILQVAVALQTAMSLNASFSSFILALLVIGFPIAMALAWFFEITPEGIKRTATDGDGTPLKPQTTDFILVGMLALVLVVALVQAVMPRDSAPSATTTSAEARPTPEPPALGNKSIAVLPFVNLSKNEDDAVFADGLTEEVLDLLARVPSGVPHQIVTPARFLTDSALKDHSKGVVRFEMPRVILTKQEHCDQANKDVLRGCHVADADDLNCGLTLGPCRRLTCVVTRHLVASEANEVHPSLAHQGEEMFGLISLEAFAGYEFVSSDCRFLQRQLLRVATSPVDGSVVLTEWRIAPLSGYAAGNGACH